MPTGETPEVLESTNPRARWYIGWSITGLEFLGPNAVDVVIVARAGESAGASAYGKT